MTLSIKSIITIDLLAIVYENPKSASSPLVLLAFAAGAFGQSVLAPPTAATGDSPDAAVEPIAVVPRDTRAISFRRDGLWFSTQDGATHLQIHGYAQADDRMFANTIHGEELDTFLFRRLRPLFEGTLLNAVDFRFMPDFGQSTYQVQEAFLELKTLKYASCAWESSRNRSGLKFALRRRFDLCRASLASDLVPLRSLARNWRVQFSRIRLPTPPAIQRIERWLQWGISQWSHGNEATARLFLRPFAAVGPSQLRQLGMGVGGSAGDQHGAIAGLKTMGQATSSNIRPLPTPTASTIGSCHRHTIMPALWD